MVVYIMTKNKRFTHNISPIQDQKPCVLNLHSSMSMSDELSYLRDQNIALRNQLFESERQAKINELKFKYAEDETIRLTLSS